MRNKCVQKLFLLLGSSMKWNTALKLGSGQVILALTILWTCEAMLKYEQI